MYNICIMNNKDYLLFYYMNYIKICPTFKLFILLLLPLILSSLISTTYNLFNNSYSKQKITTFQSQQSKHSCSLDDGPDCFLISNINSLPSKSIQLSTNTLSSLKTHLNENNIVELIPKKTKDSTAEITTSLPSSVFLTLESFDEIASNTETKVYWPKEKNIRLPVGSITVHLKGKLRLLNLKENIRHIPIKEKDLTKIEPSETFGIIEKDIKIWLDEIFILRSVYIRCLHDSVLEEKEAVIKGYKNNKVEYEIREKIKCRNNWMIIKGKENMIIDYIVFSKGIEIDNLYLTQLKGISKKNQNEQYKVDDLFFDVTNRKEGQTRYDQYEELLKKRNKEYNLFNFDNDDEDDN